MLSRFTALAGFVLAVSLAPASASALSMKECSAKYEAAKAAGTLGNMEWNDFRKLQCGTDPSSIAAPPAPNTTAAPKPANTATNKAPDASLSMKDCSAKYQSAKAAGTLDGLKWNDFRKQQCGAAASEDETVPAPGEAYYTQDPPPPSVAVPKGVAFPRSISPKYTSESAGEARMHTCLDSYHAAKDSNSLGGLKWTQKGGGYYSLCNAQLKGS